jgi:hypothetical protein
MPGFTLTYVFVPKLQLSEILAFFLVHPVFVKTAYVSNRVLSKSTKQQRFSKQWTKEKQEYRAWKQQKNLKFALEQDKGQTL